MAKTADVSGRWGQGEGEYMGAGLQCFWGGAVLGELTPVPVRHISNCALMVQAIILMGALPEDERYGDSGNDTQWLM